MREGLLAEKVGMSRFYDKDKINHSVTVLQVKECQVVSLKNYDLDGYNAVTLSHGEYSKSITKPFKEFLKKNKLEVIEIENIESKIINLKNVESSLTKYNPLKATPVDGSNKARKNAIIIIKIPNLFVFIKLFSLKKNMSNIINIKVEQKIKISGIAKSNPSIPGICK